MDRIKGFIVTTDRDTFLATFDPDLRLVRERAGAVIVANRFHFDKVRIAAAVLEVDLDQATLAFESEAEIDRMLYVRHTGKSAEAPEMPDKEETTAPSRPQAGLIMGTGASHGRSEETSSASAETASPGKSDQRQQGGRPDPRRSR